MDKTMISFSKVDITFTGPAPHRYLPTRLKVGTTGAFLGRTLQRLPLQLLPQEEQKDQVRYVQEFTTEEQARHSCQLAVHPNTKIKIKLMSGRAKVGKVRMRAGALLPRDPQDPDTFLFRCNKWAGVGVAALRLARPEQGPPKLFPINNDYTMHGFYFPASRAVQEWLKEGERREGEGEEGEAPDQDLDSTDTPLPAPSTSGGDLPGPSQHDGGPTQYAVHAPSPLPRWVGLDSFSLEEELPEDNMEESADPPHCPPLWERAAFLVQNITLVVISLLVRLLLLLPHMEHTLGELRRHAL